MVHDNKNLFIFNWCNIFVIYLDSVIHVNAGFADRVRFIRFGNWIGFIEFVVGGVREGMGAAVALKSQQCLSSNWIHCCIRLG